MNIEITIDESDMRAAVHAFLKTRYPKEITDNFGLNDFEVKMTYRANETWRRPKYLRLHVSKRTSLAQ
jgi:hypothetical protein